MEHIYTHVTNHSKNMKGQNILQLFTPLGIVPAGGDDERIAVYLRTRTPAEPKLKSFPVIEVQSGYQCASCGKINKSKDSLRHHRPCSEGKVVASQVSHVQTIFKGRFLNYFASDMQNIPVPQEAFLPRIVTQVSLSASSLNEVAHTAPEFYQYAVSYGFSKAIKTCSMESSVKWQQNSTLFCGPKIENLSPEDNLVHTVRQLCYAFLEHESRRLASSDSGISTRRNVAPISEFIRSQVGRYVGYEILFANIEGKWSIERIDFSHESNPIQFPVTPDGCPVWCYFWFDPLMTILLWRQDPNYTQ